MHLRIQSVESLENISAQDWNALNPGGNPFVRYEFLRSLEQHDAVGSHYGWLPRYVLAWREQQLVGAVPLYLKTNSYGEFVFDWAWADAYQRSGLPYFPKLVVASPYSPVTGPRLLTVQDDDAQNIRDQLITACISEAKQLGASSLHWLFTEKSETQTLQQHGFVRRLGCQFHWHNAGYRDFDDYLSEFTADKRKKIRRERKRACEAGVEIEVLDGNEISEQQWRQYHHFYASTFDRKGGIPTLSLEFFMQLGADMPDNVVLMLAKHDGEYVAGAFNLRDEFGLYGRHWGCNEFFHSLHFELCYYQGLEYAIRHGLQRFEPGAQGEHKVSRGFLPSVAYSTHWIAHPHFREAILDFLRREEVGMRHYINSLYEHSPFKSQSRIMSEGSPLDCM